MARRQNEQDIISAPFRTTDPGKRRLVRRNLNVEALNQLKQYWDGITADERTLLLHRNEHRRNALELYINKPYQIPLFSAGIRDENYNYYLSFSCLFLEHINTLSAEEQEAFWDPLLNEQSNSRVSGPNTQRNWKLNLEHIQSLLENKNSDFFEHVLRADFQVQFKIFDILNESDFRVAWDMYPVWFHYAKHRPLIEHTINYVYLLREIKDGIEMLPEEIKQNLEDEFNAGVKAPLQNKKNAFEALQTGLIAARKSPKITGESKEILKGIGKCLKVLLLTLTTIGSYFVYFSVKNFGKGRNNFFSTKTEKELYKLEDKLEKANKELEGALHHRPGRGG